MRRKRQTVQNLATFFATMMIPGVAESVVSWIESNVYIPTGAIQGRASLRMTPYLREVMERFGEKTTRHLVLCFGTQSGKTSAMIWGMLYRLCRDAQDAMWVLPNEKLAKSFSKSRWTKYVTACKLAVELVPKTGEGKTDKQLFGFLEQHFLPMVLNFVGSNSPANLSSRPVGMLIMDETDKYGDQSKFEAAAIALAEERTKTFTFPLIVKASTPTLPDRMIWTEYLLTDQRRYWVRCPRCVNEITLEFAIHSDTHGECGLRWYEEDESEAKTNGFWDMAKVKRNAHYKCQCCGGKILDFERPEMIDAGVWKPSNPLAEEGRHGYQLSSLYALLSEQTSLAAIAVEWVTSLGNRREMQNFYNSWLAEPWDDSKGFTFQKLKTEAYDQSLKFGPREDGKVPLMAVDWQHGHFWVVVRLFEPPSEKYPYGQSWQLFADKVEEEEGVVEIQRRYGVLGEHVTLDMAKSPNAVGKIIIARGWRGIWGTDTREFIHIIDGIRTGRIFSTVLFRDPHLGTRWENRTLDRVRFVKFSKAGALDLVASLRYFKGETIWHISANVAPVYARHLNSRVKMMRKNQRTGRPEWVWHELHQENHLADCENHIAILAMMNGLMIPPPETMDQVA